MSTAADSRIWVRRLAGVAVALVLLGAGGVIAVSLLRDDSPPPPTETVPPLALLRVIFPEGFTELIGIHQPRFVSPVR